MIKFSGDFKALKRFEEKLSGTGGPQTLRLVNEQLAEETIGLIRDGFERSADPYGRAWEPLVIRAGRPLEDSGGLKASWHRSETSADGFAVESGKDYAVYHQGGTGIYGPRKTPIVPIKAKALRIPGVGFRNSVKGSPKRRMVPDAGRIPPRWRKQFVETALEVLSEIFKGP